KAGGSMSSLPRSLLRRACRYWGIAPAYRDVDGEKVQVASSSLQLLLEALSQQEIRTTEDLQRLCINRREDLLSKVLEPVFALWQGRTPQILIRLCEEEKLHDLTFRIQKEDGSSVEVPVPSESLQARRRHHSGERTWVSYRVDLPLLPLGYHRLHF